MRRALRLVNLFGVVLMAVGCGGGKSPASPSPTPQPTTLNFSPTVPGFGFAQQDVNIFVSGQTTATLRWSDSRKDLDLFWTNSLCVIAGGDFAGTGCQIINRSESIAGTLETVSGPAAAGSTVRLFVINYAGAPESTTLTVTVQP